MTCAVGQHLACRQCGYQGASFSSQVKVRPLASSLGQLLMCNCRIHLFLFSLSFDVERVG